MDLNLVKNRSYEFTVTVESEFGIHARSAALITRAALKYEAQVFLEKNEKNVSGKDIFDILSLNVVKGDTLIVSAEGSDAGDAIDEIRNLMENNFLESAG